MTARVLCDDPLVVADDLRRAVDCRVCVLPHSHRGSEHWDGSTWAWERIGDTVSSWRQSYDPSGDEPDREEHR